MFDAVVRHAPRLRAAGVLKLKFDGGAVELELAPELVPIPLPLEDEPELPKASLDIPGSKCVMCATNERRYGDLCRTCARGAVSRG